ncbi:von Willebrand factor A domain-containing protein 5A-like isoform X1 [Camellia sinensis]|uniref:von Willebrand factor A domain-containing protein 5A-like isoform X1 n=1 Tax=Camellia sinensis TaxID=4442 RepID=UPI0010358501|nr:von Willebrand factor A domain-containing protein 5A-like isoform X1 [Camellia sinensis]
MAADIASSVDFGLKLSKRLYYGKDQSLSSPPKTAAMEKSSEGYVPTAVMVYAVISEPSIVDNPDVPSYQPYVHGRCDPPALIPLHMHRIEMEVDCYLDTAFVTVSGTWRVHCVMSSKSCDCRIMIPMGDQGSVLGVEVDDGRRSYHTQLIPMEDAKDSEKVAKAKDGFLLKRQIYTLKVPQVEGGSNIFMKASWSQKLLYEDGKFCLSVPFSFPAYVKPVGKKIAKREKITLSVNPGTGTEVLCKTSSHPLKEVRRQVGKLGFLYDAEVLMWSSADFFFSYDVPSSHIFGGLLLQSASLNDIDQREMFCLYLFPGNSQNRKVFRKEVVFLVDISGSMRDGPIENAKSALLAALSKLSLIDSFNIIAFNVDTQLFSSSMVLATKEAKENATQWISRNFIAEGGTNILLPLTQALEMLEKTSDSIPLIFLITDGAVEDERHICNAVQSQFTNRKRSICPRICTFGIGSYCNHYFLQMLAQIGRGYYDVAFAVDSVNFQIQRLFNAASSVILANITIDALECLDSLELYPNLIPDLSSGSPLIVSGRYHGNFPDSVKASGLLPDMSNFTVELEVQKSKNIPLDRVFARRQIDILTAHAWLLENKQLEEKVAKMSIQTRVPSEYSHVILVQTDKGKPDPESVSIQEKVADLIGKKIIFLRNLGIGFGNLAATVENRPPSTEEVKLHETSEIMAKAAARCCSRLLDRCCCMCFIQACSWMNDQCAVALTQLCTALACFECLNCCCEVCISCDLC